MHSNGGQEQEYPEREEDIIRTFIIIIKYIIYIKDGNKIVRLKLKKN